MSRLKLALIMYEGLTEQVFYKHVFKNYLPKTISPIHRNLKGGSGREKEVRAWLSYILTDSKYDNYDLYAYVFIDREGPATKVSNFQSEAIVNRLNNTRVKSVCSIEAIKMIESWFFHDIEGICKYAGLSYTSTLQKNYCSPPMYDAKTLGQLIQKGSKKKVYIKGEEAFVKALDIDRIYNNCPDLRNGITLINNECT